jgi:ATP-dependent RNA helicase DDX24/MAK5
LAKPKQDRLLLEAPEIVVATPGRLYEMLNEGVIYLADFSKLQYFVLDEADRMIENGHFKELDFIISRLPTKEYLRFVVICLYKLHLCFGIQSVFRAQSKIKRRQTFIFSATMMFDHGVRAVSSRTMKGSELGENHEARRPKLQL